MAARRYEISLRASEGSERVKCFWTREEKFRLSKRSCDVLFIIYTPKKIQTISLKYFFAAKGVTYYVAIATSIFSLVKITCYFQVWRYNIMFSRESSPVSSLVLYNKTLYLSYLDFDLNGKFWSAEVMPSCNRVVNVFLHDCYWSRSLDRLLLVFLDSLDAVVSSVKRNLRLLYISSFYILEKWRILLLTNLL